MGGDGGSIPGRADLVRTKQKLERISRDLEAFMRWKMCALTQQALQAPIVACQLGRLYNKEAIVKYLLNKASGVPLASSSAGGAEQWDVVKHIRSLKDVRELQLTKNPAFKDEKPEEGGSASFRDMNIAPFICPIVGVEMNGKYRFAVLWECGCVVSDRAMKEVGQERCPRCSQSYNHDDVLFLNPPDDELGDYFDRMERRRGAAKARKKKARKLSSKTMDSITPAGCSSSDHVDVGARDHDMDDSGGGKVDAGIAEQSTGRKNVKKTIKQKRSVVTHTNANGSGSADLSGKTTMIQSDPSKSKIFKSLFTTSEIAQKKAKEAGPWVTYNPFYN